MPNTINTLILYIYLPFILFFTINSQTNSDFVSSFIKEELSPVLISTINELNRTKTLSKECLNILGSSFINDNNYLYAYKLYKDSSHNIEDLGYFSACLDNVYHYPYNSAISTKNISDKFTYILYYIPESPSCKDKSFIFGACLPKGCVPEEYKLILKEFNKQTELIEHNCLTVVETFDTTKKLEINYTFYFGLPAVVFFIIITIFNIFPRLPREVFKCCFRKNKKFNSSTLDTVSKQLESTNISNLIEPSNATTYIHKNARYYDVGSLNKLKRCFSFSGNFSEMLSEYSTLHESRTNNDSGISFIRGLRGIILILYVFGEIFKTLFLSPLKDSSSRKDFDTFTYSSLYFITRYSYRMLLSISGFTLCYKLLCYLDLEFDSINIKEDELEPTQITTMNNNDPIANEIETGDQNLLWDQMLFFNKFETSVALYKKIPTKTYFAFIGRQVHKYLIFVLVLLILKFSYYEISMVVSFIFGRNPMQEFILQQIRNKAQWFHILGHVLLYFPFMVPLSTPSENLYSHAFDMVILEISLFIMFSLFIFVSYKNNLKMEIGLISIFVFISVIKVVMYLILFKEFGEGYPPIPPFFPAKDFMQKDWNFLRANPIYNSTSVIIGLFFGLVNYVIQNRNSEGRCFLFIAEKFTKSLMKYQTIKIIIITFSFIVYISWCLISYLAIFTLIKQDPLLSFYDNKYVNIYFLFDTDVAIFLTFLVIIPYTLIGENSFISFLSHNYWGILSKQYYTFILLIGGIMNVLIYQTSRKIILGFNIIGEYSLITLVFGTFICMLLYVLFELPLKKLNKLIVKPKKSKKKKTS